LLLTAEDFTGVTHMFLEGPGFTFYIVVVSGKSTDFPPGLNSIKFSMDREGRRGSDKL
jgi:hypothetical protein